MRSFYGMWDYEVLEDRWQSLTSLKDRLYYVACCCQETAEVFTFDTQFERWTARMLDESDMMFSLQSPAHRALSRGTSEKFFPKMLKCVPSPEGDLYFATLSGCRPTRYQRARHWIKKRVFKNAVAE
eukprot:gene3655-4590_t